MMHLVLDVQSTNHTDECSQLNAWVNVNNHTEAMLILQNELTQEGWALTNIVESSSTTADDYFAPCESLDAFNEAERSLFALRFTSS